MKKLTIVTTAFFLAAILFSSCKSHKTCPAYSSIEKNPSNRISS